MREYVERQFLERNLRPSHQCEVKEKLDTFFSPDAPLGPVNANDLGALMP
ncbi:unnamed protein product [Amoebophrya sp. A25]|nr:unnamed protein product [Amoebophrya sp. A25]|eukprot:GSA25T00006649001.1